MNRSCIFISLLTFWVSLTAQDGQFLNVNQDLLNVNPSFAGSNGGIRNQFSFRSQLARGFPGMPKDFSNNLDVYINGIRAGVGVTGMNQTFGPLSTSGLGVIYAQHFSLNQGRSKLIPSIQAVYIKRTIDVGWLVPVTGEPIETTHKYVKINSGLLFSHEDRLFIGVSAFHINRPNGMFPSYLLYASYNFRFGKNSVLQVMSNLTYRLGGIESFQSGANILLAKWLMFGGGYESDKALYVQGGYRASTFVISLCYYKTYRLSNMVELQTSINLRNKERRQLVTSPESM